MKDGKYMSTELDVQQVTITSTLTNGATIKMHVCAFKTAGNITIDNETIAVKTGEVLIHHHEKIIFHICSFNHN